MRVVSLAILCCLVGTGCAFGDDPDGSALDEAALRKLVLQQTDLPRAFIRFDEGRQISADLPTGARAHSGRFGRLGGWKARFRRPGTQMTAGPLVVESRADLFESADGAKDELEAAESEPTPPESAQWSPVDTPGIGDESFVLTATERSFGGGVRYYLIVWRDDNVTASVLASGFADRFTLDDALRLARRQQRRTAAATSS
jgi:hypothetical protein